MKKRCLAVGLLCLNIVAAWAQPGLQQGPRLGGSMAKLFGEHSAFSADLEMLTRATGDNITVPGKMAYDRGKYRFEINTTEMKGGSIPADAACQMKSLGMDKMTMIARPDKKLNYLVFPGLEAYAEMPLQDPDDAAPAEDFKVETTELGKETLDGHPCVKNKAVVTDAKGKKVEATLWNAADLKKFPVRIDYTEKGASVTLLFKNVKFSRPESSAFEPAAGLTKYDSIQAMMQGAIMKRLGGAAGGQPPGQ